MSDNQDPSREIFGSDIHAMLQREEALKPGMDVLSELESRDQRRLAQYPGRGPIWHLEKQHLENVRREDWLPRLSNDRSTCLRGPLFCLELRGCCSEARPDQCCDLMVRWRPMFTYLHCREKGDHEARLVEGNKNSIEPLT